MVQRRVSLNFMLIAAVVILAFSSLLLQSALAMLEAADTSHAFVRHGSAAISARQCTSRGDSVSFYNPNTDRKGLACLVDGKWGVVIQDADGNEVTAFMKEKLKGTFEAIQRYMDNAGYTILQ